VEVPNAEEQKGQIFSELRERPIEYRLYLEDVREEI